MEMIFVDRPYVSDFFKETIKKNNFPVVQTETAKDLGFRDDYKLFSEEEAVKVAGNGNSLLIYTNSENSIGWMAEHLDYTGLPEKVNLFKDKVQFRKMIKPLFRDFYFKEVYVNELDELDINLLPLPFVIKPSLGFFSVGVYMVMNRNDWENTKTSIRSEMARIKGVYPAGVVETSVFIIEEVIEGEEFAIDAYYNSSGKPVVLNIFKHIFSSAGDVSDRVYMSSGEIIEKNMGQFTEFLAEIGKLAGVRNFPVHVEIRRDALSNIVPVEINPLRFGGFCTTADITWFSYGINSYEYFFYQKSPDWEEVLKDKEGKIYSIIVLDNSTGVGVDEISSFDYDLLLTRFENPIELRKLDYKKYNAFGFVFVETKKENFHELKDIMESDLREFIS